jgi:hypothetical protein
MSAPAANVFEGTTVYPMTVEQEAMWLDDRLTQDPSRYLESWVYRLTGPVDRTAVQAAWGGIVARHEALRSGFDLDGELPVQRVRPADRMPPLAVRPCPAEKVDSTLRELTSAPLDLTRHAVRPTLLDIAPDTVILAVQMHHIVLDDWTLHLLEREFQEHYLAVTEERPVMLKPVPLQPGPYAARQRSVPRDPAVVEYWRERLADLPGDAGDTLPADQGTPSTPEHQPGAREVFSISPLTARQLRRLCGRLRVTPFTVFAAAMALLLHSAEGAEDVLFTTPVSHRGAAEVDQMIAPLSRLLPLRLRVRPEDTFADLVAQARARTHEAIEHRDVSAGDLARVTRRRGQPKRDLYRTALVLDDAAEAGMAIPGLSAERLFVFPGTSKFDLCFYLTAAGGGYDGMLDYSADRYSPATARRWIDRMLTLLDRATADSDATAASLVG